MLVWDAPFLPVLSPAFSVNTSVQRRAVPAIQNVCSGLTWYYRCLARLPDTVSAFPLLNDSASYSGWIYYVSIAANKHFWWSIRPDSSAASEKNVRKGTFIDTKNKYIWLAKHCPSYNCFGDQRKILGYSKAAKALERDLPPLLLPSHIKWRQIGLLLQQNHHLWSFSKYIYRRGLKAFAGSAVLPQGYSTRVWEGKAEGWMGSQEWHRAGKGQRGGHQSIPWGGTGTTRHHLQTRGPVKSSFSVKTSSSS